MTMNDPHVKAIHYLIDHDDSVEYRDVAPLAFEDDLFHVKAEKLEVVFEPKNHYATAEEATDAVGGLVRRWEFEAALRAQSSEFRLVYAGADIIDLNPPPPPPGVVNLGPITVRAGIPKAQMRLTKVAANYPAPPQGPDIDPDDPDASFMLYRLDLYRQGREPLGSVATSASRCWSIQRCRLPEAKGANGKAAANHYQIQMTVLNGVAMLSANKGGPMLARPKGAAIHSHRRRLAFLRRR